MTAVRESGFWMGEFPGFGGRAIIRYMHSDTQKLLTSPRNLPIPSILGKKLFSCQHQTLSKHPDF
jgi:hypothetical protein